MAVGESKIKKQVAGRGLFAHVRMEVAETDLPGRFDSSEALGTDAKYYLSVVESATRYTWERLQAEDKHPPQVDIRITELSVILADTSVMAVFYASVLAFCDAIGLQLDNPPVIDATTRTLRLPL